MVDIVVEPVGVDQLAGGAPPDNGGLVGVVVGEVVPGHLDVQPTVHVPPVFLGQGVSVVFQVAQEKELAAVLGFYSEHPGLLRHGQDFQTGDLADVLLQHFRVPGVGGIEPVVNPRNRGEEGLSTLWSKTPKSFWGRAYLGIP